MTGLAVNSAAFCDARSALLAGSYRALSMTFRSSQERELEVSYDFNEQYRILAEDVEEYLMPIYATEAQFVVCVLGPMYPQKIWTKFESKHFEERFK